MSGASDGAKERKPRKSRFDEPEDEEKKRQERWSDEKLNPMSPNFKPLEALYASETILPDPKAPAYDNLGKYESIMEGKAASTSAVSKRSAKHVEYTDLPVRDLTGKSLVSVYSSSDNGFRWGVVTNPKLLTAFNSQEKILRVLDMKMSNLIYHEKTSCTNTLHRSVQEAVWENCQQAGVKHDTFDNVVKWMKEVNGPLKAFQVCMEKKVKVKIITRAAAGIRGHVIGYVTAFDKVWNLAVEDAVEVWTRKRKKKTIPEGGAVRQIPKETEHLRMIAPTIKVTRVNKTFEKCERKVDKLLLKGEHIVLVSIVDY